MPYFDDVTNIYEEWKAKMDKSGTKYSHRICALLKEDLDRQ